MLNAMRQSAGSWIIKVLLGIIVVAFTFMGVGSFNARQNAKVATVNGDIIDITQYQRAYYNVLENLRAQFGNQLNDEMIKMFNVRQQALDGLIETTLLHQTAKEIGLRVPDAELAQSIAQIPAFQQNGAFDPQRYKILLSQNRLTPESFEAMQKEAMMMDRRRAMVTKSAKVSENEIRQWYEWENTSVDVDYAVFKAADFKDVAVTDQMLREYYDAHKEKYKTQPKLQARYVKFDPESYQSSAVVSTDEIKQYYDEHPEEFKQPETVSARHILFKVPQDADAETDEAVRQKAVTVMEKARAGEDFAELAKTYSEGPSKDKGGQLGEFKREDMVKPFSDAAFAMAAGDISEPVKTQFGWHVIKVETHNPASTLSLEQATGRITEKLADRKARNLAYDAALSLYDITFDGAELEKNAKDSGLELITTDFFTRQKGPENIANPSAFAETALQLPMMELSDITEIGEAYYLIQAIGKEPEQIPDFEEIKDKITKDAKQARQKTAAKEAAEQFLEKAKSAGSIATAAEEEPSVTVKSTGHITRKGSVPGIGNDQKFITAAFALTNAGKIPDQVVEGQSGLYVIELKERKAPMEQGLDIAKASIHDRILSQKQNALYTSWVDELRKNSEITISREFLNN
jgi:peptidyl-prolyl cis-trans isomerase D